MANEKVIIIAVKQQKQTNVHFESSLAELQSLSNTAGGDVVQIFTQKREKMNPATYLGSGKIEEIITSVQENDVDLVIANDELSPIQLRNLSIALGVRMIDRSQLILDIFAQRARTKEGKLQVELAQLEYLLPRLRGQGTELSRLGGGIGTRGPGETKLETDQRHIRRRIHDIKQRLQTVVKQREQYRKRRKTNDVVQIAIVGYTNAGKSTLFNRLTNSDSLEEDQLFATLDPLTRQIQLPSGMKVLITDTVGFLQDLPTSLIAAFKSTLEEVTEADFLIHMVDGSHPDLNQQQDTVLRLLKELQADTIPMLTVYNKKDLFEQDVIPMNHPYMFMTAHREADIQQLLRKVENLLKAEWQFYSLSLLPDQGKLLQQLEQDTIIESKLFLEEKQVYKIKGYMRKDIPLNRLLEE
ncbi:GTPase HflX [Virgibacillus pantothenticus]|uniref:GTPase HflX n=1 Tax=Virgibacillus pantothenticus TaxID=1473 RepID=UPI001C2147FC|nr:GTPase HflX [Virgibacillus pantothenticus]MBU8566024.1 GTPase HflX [Virgibacillus pantothenticus]MBU8601001.1 GTPase HflX [Virgibacillus pantothenticus]MBU8632996.1 GTPase HflX [Virgibacillus pantothenticus]MBU8643151.1 GTPase HflX [Virgibacillus pantothenticus]MBU8647197.1 GTPase HflX [Virgibacillus pantothenticus]